MSRGENDQVDGLRWRSSRERICGGGDSDFVAPGSGFHRLGGQTAMPGRREIVVWFILAGATWSRGKQKGGVRGGFSIQQRGRRKRGPAGRTGRRRRAVVGAALPLESEIGEVRREANGWEPAAAREREREGENRGCMGRPREKEKRVRPDGIVKNFIYSKKIKTV
jgi:hypothetical protein